MNNTIVLIVGKSGSGKTTIAESCSSYGLTSIQSYTTRKPRTPDETGHTFVTKEEFDALPDKVAYVEYNGNHYCATSQQVEENDIYVIDPKGIEYFKEHYNGSKKVVTVYIVADADPHTAFSTLYERMKERGDTTEMAAQRVALDNYEFRDFEKNADYVFVNKNKPDIDVICNAISRIVKYGEVSDD